jgi:hypothetical protein
LNDKQPNTRRSTYQLLGKIPNYPGLYRHTINGTYYGVKKIAGKRKEHSLDTADRKIAERRFKDRVANLDEVDSEVEKTTLARLIEKFRKTREGRRDKTKKTEAWIVGMLKRDWGYGLDIQVGRIRPSMLDEWLAKQATEKDVTLYATEHKKLLGELQKLRAQVAAPAAGGNTAPLLAVVN